MLPFQQPSMPVQITGPADAVAAVLDHHEIEGARRYECHSQVWIEAPGLSRDLEAHVRSFGCKVHHRG